MKINRDAVESFTHHINNIDDHIKFTCDPEKDCQLPFLDTLVTEKPGGSIKVSVYRKAIHIRKQGTHFFQTLQEFTPITCCAQRQTSPYQFAGTVYCLESEDCHKHNIGE